MARKKDPRETLPAKRKKNRKGTIYVPSRPGEYPHMDTGVLRKSIYRGPIETQADGTMLVKVGTKVFYGKILELTQKPNGRPFLRRTLHEESQRIRDILAGKAGASVMNKT